MVTENAPLPADDLRRGLTLVKPGPGQNLPCISVVGDTYTVLVTGENTAGRYCLIDMLVPPGGGPPPHRHDFEEMFILLEGEIEVTFRGEKTVVRAGDTANVPANAPHHFRNISEKPAHLLCLCSPAGLEEYFLAVGIPLESRASPPPRLSPAEAEAIKAKLGALAGQYRVEFVAP